VVSSKSKNPVESFELERGFWLENLAIPTFALVGTTIGPESLTAVFGMGTGAFSESAIIEPRMLLATCRRDLNQRAVDN
jgi:hypothetical protein